MDGVLLDGEVLCDVVKDGMVLVHGVVVELDSEEVESQGVVLLDAGGILLNIEVVSQGVVVVTLGYVVAETVVCFRR